jgi:hypothetical protein
MLFTDKNVQLFAQLYRSLLAHPVGSVGAPQNQLLLQFSAALAEVRIAENLRVWAYNRQYRTRRPRQNLHNIHDKLSSDYDASFEANITKGFPVPFDMLIQHIQRFCKT